MSGSVDWVGLTLFLTAVIGAFFIGRNFDSRHDKEIADIKERLRALEKR